MKLEAVYTWEEIKKLIELELTTNGYRIVDEIFPMGAEVIRFHIEPQSIFITPATDQAPAQLPAPSLVEEPAPPVIKTRVKEPAPDGNWISAKIAANTWNIGLSTLCKAAQDGKVKGIKQHNNWYLDQDDVARYASTVQKRPRASQYSKDYSNNKDLLLMSKATKCPDCHAHKPSCGWALPFEELDGKTVIICKNCFDKRLAA